MNKATQVSTEVQERVVRELKKRSDNALAETINGLYKAEVIHRLGPWKSLESVELATSEWVSWFNQHRLLGSIDPYSTCGSRRKLLSQSKRAGHVGLPQTK